MKKLLFLVVALFVFPTIAMDKNELVQDVSDVVVEMIARCLDERYFLDEDILIREKGSVVVSSEDCRVLKSLHQIKSSAEKEYIKDRVRIQLARTLWEGFQSTASLYEQVIKEVQCDADPKSVKKSKKKIHAKRKK